MTKFYKRGVREYFMISPEKCIRVINKKNRTEVTICFDSGDGLLSGWGMDSLGENAKEGQEISRAEFAAQLAVAQRLIVLED